MALLPIKFHEHLQVGSHFYYDNFFQLASVGIRAQNICFANVTMESDRHIVVREMVFPSVSSIFIICI